MVVAVIISNNNNGPTQNQDQDQDSHYGQKEEEEEEQKEEEYKEEQKEEEHKEEQKEEEYKEEEQKEEEQKEEETTPIEPTSQCPEIKEISGGVKGSGHATRYWDCCKPSCSWTTNAGSGNEARQCDKNMNPIIDLMASSICDGGVSTTCLSQIPFTINGCDNIGFAFGAVPGTSPMCGRCFLLEFTGIGKYETKKNHRLLQGKKLIVMASNIGYDVQTYQFDIMIPGGGVGIYNGCDEILGKNLGERYGGLLSDCEMEVGWGYDDDTIYTKRKECLTNKCNTIFAKNANAKKGCLFLSDYMEAAGNPLHTFKEIECPKILKEKY